MDFEANKPSKKLNVTLYTMYASDTLSIIALHNMLLLGDFGAYPRKIDVLRIACENTFAFN